MPSQPRRNPVKKRKLAEEPSPANSNGTEAKLDRTGRDESPQLADQLDLLKREVYCSITGSRASESSTLNLHYGPSSTFVFLQQLYRFLLAGSSDNKGNADAAVSPRSRFSTTDLPLTTLNYTTEAISEFGYDSIYFGVEPSPSSDPTHPNSTSQDLASYHPSTLPFDLAGTFLEMYLSTVHHVFLFCSASLLRELLYTMYEDMHSPDSSHTQSSRNWTMVMAVLSLGAGLSGDEKWAEALYRVVKTRLNDWGDGISLRSVQCSLLVAEYHLSLGRPHSAKMEIERAVQKAFAVGLHRETGGHVLRGQHGQEGEDNGNGNDTERGAERNRARERQATFWAVYATDRNLSLGLGRPPFVNDLDVSLSDPVWDPALLSTVRLARIAANIYYRVYGRDNALGSIPSFCQRVQNCYGELIAFYNALPEGLRFPVSEGQLEHQGMGGKSFSTSQMVSAFGFFQTLITCLRPCLVLDAAMRRGRLVVASNSKKNNDASTQNDSPLIPPSWSSWLSSAATQCRLASKQIISVFSLGVSSNSFISCMRHSRFFIEGACFALLFDVVRDPLREGVEENFEAVRRGLECFQRLPRDRLLGISLRGVGRLAGMTRELVDRERRAAGLGGVTGLDGKGSHRMDRGDCVREAEAAAASTEDGEQDQDVLSEMGRGLWQTKDDLEAFGQSPNVDAHANDAENVAAPAPTVTIVSGTSIPKPPVDAFPPLSAWASPPNAPAPPPQARQGQPQAQQSLYPPLSFAPPFPTVRNTNTQLNPVANFHNNHSPTSLSVLTTVPYPTASPSTGTQPLTTSSPPLNTPADPLRHSNANDSDPSNLDAELGDLSALQRDLFADLFGEGEIFNLSYHLWCEEGGGEGGGVV
jgi:hypothetical protein